MENLVNNTKTWDSVCIVGLGSHAKNKILPALKFNKLKVLGIVSRDSSKKLKDVTTFVDIMDAIKFLPERTLFIVSSPPNLHYQQVKILIKSGRDVFIEKPAFLSVSESKELTSLANSKKIVLAEMLMYLENQSVKRLLEKIQSNYNQVSKIEFKFLIPSVPKNTFRDESNLGNSLLADMACYPLSFLLNCNLDISHLKLQRCKNTSGIYNIIGDLNSKKIDIKVGQGSKYYNSIRIFFKDNSKLTCKPFFYGRAGVRELILEHESIVKKSIIHEQNAFNLLFSKSRSFWIKSQQERNFLLNKVSEKLELFGQNVKY
tara:strand:- start:86 stop:1036 length:951 start_codon:yes stop_codon:yes gene_type:complete